MHRSDGPDALLTTPGVTTRESAGGAAASSSAAPAASASLSAGLPLGIFAVLALLATLLGRGVAPALPGSSVGIGRWISVAQTTSAILSQLVAAGAVAFVLRMTGLILTERRFGFALRALALPAVTCVAALCIAAAHDGLDPKLESVMALACLVSVFAAAPLGLKRSESRAFSLFLLLVGARSAVDFAALLTAIRASEAASPAYYSLARGLSTAGFGLGIAALGMTVAWLSRRSGPRAAVLGASFLIVGFVLALVAREGQTPDPAAWTVVVSQIFREFARPPAPFVASVFRNALAAATGVSALYCAFARDRLGVGPLFTLGILGMGAVDMPLAALLLCAAALSVSLVSFEKNK